jgi:hypothetical protein
MSADSTNQNPELFFVGEAVCFQPSMWECTPILRWKIGVLQQLWREIYSGNTEWRDVQQAEDTE